MKRLFGLIGMTVGSWLGWQLGAVFSFFAAFMISMIGSGIGLYAAHRASSWLLP